MNPASPPWLPGCLVTLLSQLAAVNLLRELRLNQIAFSHSLFQATYNSAWPDICLWLRLLSLAFDIGETDHDECGSINAVGFVMHLQLSHFEKGRR